MGLMCIMCKGDDRQVGTIRVQATSQTSGSRTHGGELICETHREEAWASMEAWQELNPGEPLRGEPGEPSTVYCFNGIDRAWSIYLLCGYRWLN